MRTCHHHPTVAYTDVACPVCAAEEACARAEGAIHRARAETIAAERQRDAWRRLALEAVRVAGDAPLRAQYRELQEACRG